MTIVATGPTAMAVGPVKTLASDARLVVILHHSIEGEGALGIEDAGIDIACFVACVAIVDPREVTWRNTRRAFANVTGHQVNSPLM